MISATRQDASEGRARPRGQGSRLARWGGVASLLLLAAGPAALRGQEQPPPPQAARLQIGIAPGTWQGLNRNDASAALATWAKAFVRQQKGTLEVGTELFGSKDELNDALHQRRVGAASMLTDQFIALESEFHPDAVFVTTRNQTFTEQYVLLVRRNSGIADCAGLRGRTLVMQSNSRMCLAWPWLETLLARRSLPKAETVFQAVTKIESPSKAVLQVYFRQADAAIVTAEALAVASELNPQLRRELLVLDSSPEVVPAVFFLLPGLDAATKEQVEDAIFRWPETSAGRQALMVFQSDGMTKQPLSCLQTTRQLLADYARALERQGEQQEREL
jgi:ABC-type phosphate/phosphonate transport system substrate-binding protein